MAQTAQEQIVALTETLNRYRDEYYNLNAPSVTDAEYDRLFDKLKELEQSTGIQLANSPTQTVGYPAVSTLEKVTHSIPLLSLEKVTRSEQVRAFIAQETVLMMPKLDGLTLKLTYENGSLVEAATRGDGSEGENVTHNARSIRNIPMRIPYTGRLVVSGEAFIRPSDFEALRGGLLDRSGKPYKNGRNLAAGSVRLHDAKTCAERRVTFMAFSVLEGLDQYALKSDRLQQLWPLGFTVCHYLKTKRALTEAEVDLGIHALEQYASDSDIPIDGVVVTYNNIAFSRSCGRTGHHYKDGVAFKFEDDTYESRLREIEWTPTRTGEIAPVAVFDTVEIDGCAVSRASLHNLSFIEALELMPGNRIRVSKRHMIIPHIEDNLDRGGFVLDAVIPHTCPCCGEPTRIHETKSVADGEEKTTRTLYCDNPGCETRRLRQFVHFASEKAMDMEGLSAATLEKFIGRGFVHSYMDLYRLDEHRAEIVQMEGFGEKSWQRLWDAIQRSRNTTFERYLIAMDIPMIGNTASRTLARQFHSSLDAFEEAVASHYDFTQLPDFGETLHQNIYDWFAVEENWYIWYELREFVHIAPPPETPAADPGNSPLAGLTIVVTGKVEPYTREGINAQIEALGAHAGSSVSSKTNYLVCGENAGSKLDKARALGIPVLTPAEFFQMAGIA